MKKLTKTLLIAALIAIVGWTALSTLYTHALSDRLATLRTESHSNLIYLRGRIRELESELTAALLSGHPTTPPEVDRPVDVPPETTAPEQDTTPEEPDTEAVTLPVHNSPEPAPSGYRLAISEGRIAVFDPAGDRLETLNVFVHTLPACDREALLSGISLPTWADVLLYIERYQ